MKRFSIALASTSLVAAAALLQWAGCSSSTDPATPGTGGSGGSGAGGSDTGGGGVAAGGGGAAATGGGGSVTPGDAGSCKADEVAPIPGGPCFKKDPGAHKTCGASDCSAGVASNFGARACCTEENTCGADFVDGPGDASTAANCIPLNQEGKATSKCPDHYNPYIPAMFKSMTSPLKGCCQKLTGTCAVVEDFIGFGCFDFGGMIYDDQDGGAGPFCNPTTGELADHPIDAGVKDSGHVDATVDAADATHE